MTPSKQLILSRYFLSFASLDVSLMHVRTKLNLTEKNFQSHSQCLCVTCLEIRLNWVAVYCGELFRESQVLLSRFV